MNKLGKTVTIQSILKHKRCSVIRENSSTPAKIVNIANAAQKSTTLKAFENNYNQLIENLDSSVASEFALYPLSVLEFSELKLENLDQYVDKYIVNAIPKMDSNGLAEIKSHIDEYTKIPKEYIEKIKESVEEAEIIERILVNHETFSKRFDLEDTIIKSNKLGSDILAEQVKGLIDTYKVKPYQKMNLCLEEVFYVLGKNNISYNKQETVKSIVESFLLDKDAYKDIDKFHNVLKENYCFTEDEVMPSDKMMTDDSEAQTIETKINEFIRVGTIPLYDLCVGIGGCSLNDIKNNIITGLHFVWKVINHNRDISFEEMNEAIEGLFITMANKINDGTDVPTIEDITLIKTEISEFLDKFGNKVNNVMYPGDAERFENFSHQVILNMDQFVKDCSYLYNKANVDAIAYVNKESTVVTLQEFKKFRFTNLIKAAINLEKYVKAKAKSFFHKKKKKPFKFIKKARNILFGEDVAIEPYIQEDGRVDICVDQFYYDEADEYFIKDFLNDVCKEFNDKLMQSNMAEMRAYYIFNPGVGELHIKENTRIELTAEEAQSVREAIDPSLELYIEALANTDTQMDYLVQESNIKESLYENKMSYDAFEMLVEALSYTGVSKQDVELLEHQFESVYDSVTESTDYQTDIEKARQLVENFEPANDIIPDEIKLEAATVVKSILEIGPNIKKPDIKKADASKAPDKKKDKDDNKDNGEKESKGFNFDKFSNNLKLGLAGLKAKLGDMGQKEKEASKNLDATAGHFMKAIHDGLVSDRREAIIKGSVIPSFSKCVKNAITLIGIGGVSMLLVGNILPAIIVAFGGFALSKHLTKRERLLMLDDIEVELDVVEKEIANAESKNQMKKYRALLRYKKDLQRQYQRIKYNVRIGKDILPGSATGVYKRD